jgi:hypothetical protein
MTPNNRRSRDDAEKAPDIEPLQADRSSSAPFSQKQCSDKETTERKEDVNAIALMLEQGGQE